MRNDAGNIRFAGVYHVSAFLKELFMRNFELSDADLKYLDAALEIYAASIKRAIKAARNDDVAKAYKVDLLLVEGLRLKLAV